MRYFKLNYIKIFLISMIVCLFAQAGQAQTLGSLYSSEENELLLDKKTDLKLALDLLEQRYNVVFLYRSNIIEGIETLHITSLTGDIEKTLKSLLEGTELKFKNLNPKTYGIYEANKNYPTLLLPLSFQEVVEGTVTDAGTGEALPGVNIFVQDTNIGTVTDINGNFSLNVPTLNETLVVSYIGYQTNEIPLNGNSNFDITLEALVVRGEEMVVTAFGIQREQRSLSYSTQGVGITELSEARELNVMQSLQGKVAGLSINQGDDGLGSNARVVIRGNRSISGDSQPLYVIDGVPVRGNPSTLNPDNIASINVMKGPNAAALYGSSAQDGAIIIETIKGQSGVVNVSLNNTFMVRSAKNNYQLQNEFGQGSGGIYDGSSEFNWGPRMEGQLVDHWSPDPALAGQQYPFSPQPGNVDDFYNYGFNMSNNILTSIGGESIQAVFSYTHTDAKGILPNNDLKRHNVSLRLNSELTEGLRLDTKLDYMQQKINGGNLAEVRFEPWRHIVRIPRNISTEQFSNFEYETPEGDIRQNYFNPGSSIGANPYWIANRALQERNGERIIALTSLTYNFTEEVSLMTRASYDGSNDGFEERQYNDNYLTAPLGFYAAGESNSSIFNSDFLLSYSEDVSPDWSVNVNFGGNLEQRRNNSVSTNTGDALLVPNLFTISNTLRPQSSRNQGSPVNVQSLYSFSQIGWRDALYLDITGRNDWSSTLPEGNRSYFYPSVGISAVISDLIPDFPEKITYAKLRASWAETGSGAPPQMGAREAFFYAGGNRGYLEFDDTLPAETLRPERTESIEIGADIRLFSGRIGLDFTYYRTNTFDQLFTLALPLGSGASELFTNGGDVQNKGVEVLLRTRPIQTQEFDWYINFNYAKNNSLVRKINDARPQVVRNNGTIRDFVIEEGRPFGEMYGRGWLRDEQGRVIVSSDGLPRTTSGKSEYLGNFSPDWTGSVSNEFSYKNFSGSFLIEHRQGGTVLSRADAVLAADGLLERTLQGREGGLIFGENIFTNETAVLDDGSPNTIAINAESLWRHVGGRSQPVGEVFANDATYTRVREVTVGYTIPQSILAGLNAISNIKVSLVGRNLFYLYKATPGMDADFLDGTGVTSEGQQYFVPPTTSSFGANLKIDF